MRNFLNLYVGHVKNSRRIIMIAAIGLICTLTIVSASNYYFDNSKILLVDNYFATNSSLNKPDAAITFESYYSDFFNAIPYISKIVNQTQANDRLNYIKSIDISAALEGLNITVGDKLNNATYTRFASIVQLNAGLTKELTELNNENPIIKNSVVPKLNSNSSIPQVFVLFINYDLYGSASTNYFMPQYANHTASFTNYNVTFGVKSCPPLGLPCYQRTHFSFLLAGASVLNLGAEVCQVTSNSCQKNPNFVKYPNIYNLRSYIAPEAIIFTPNLTQVVSQVISKTKQFYNPNSFFRNHMSYSISINLAYNTIDPYNAQAIASEITNFEQIITNGLLNSRIFFAFSSLNNAKYSFDYIGSQFFTLIFNLFIVSLPMLIATIFLTNYSFGLIHRNVIRHIGIYKTRGASSWTILLFQLFDSILIIFISALVALITGVPIGMLAFRSDSLLSFNSPVTANFILNFPAVFSLVFYTAIILTLIVNFRRVIRLSKVTIVETEQPEESEDPFWKKHYLDIFLFAFGMFTYIIFYIFSRLPSSSATFGSITILLAILALPGLLALVISIILLINRIIPVILNKIGTLFWARTGNLVAFSFKNVIRHKQASTRAVMLITVLFVFTLFFYSYPFSALQNNANNLYYSNGAEGVGSFDYSGYNRTTLSIIQNNFSQYLKAYSPFTILSGSSGSSIPYAIMFINISSYLDSAYLNFDLGLKNTITSDIANLKLPNGNFSSLNILVDKSSLQSIKGSIGSTLTFLGSSSHSDLNVHVIDSFSHWPILNANFNNKEVMGIADINYYLNILHRNLTNTFFDHFYTYSGVFFNFKNGVNQTLVSNSIIGNTSISSMFLESQQQLDFSNNIQFRVELGQININILMMFSIIIIVILFFAYFQINDRKKEIFTERAIGMKLHQIASLFLIETIILSVTSILLGIIIGTFLMELLSIVLFNPLQSYPVPVLVYPINSIIIMSLLILTCSILASIIPAYYITKQDIGKTFGEN